MGKLAAGFIGFVLLVVFLQSYILGDDDDPLSNATRGGAAPTATLPAQLPEAVVLGEGAAGDSTTGGQTAGGGTYVVQSGDTLGSIAASLNIAPEAQAAWIQEVLDLNGIADARLLQAGQELVLPGAPAAGGGSQFSGGGPGPASTPSGGIVTPTPGTGGGTGGGGTYIVVSGDTPFGIAEKHCVEGAAAWVNELIALNGIDPSNLTVGQELELPAGTPAQCSGN